MLNQSQRVAATITAILGILTLSACLIRSCSTIKEKEDTISTLETTVESQKKIINNQTQESKGKEKRISFLSKRLDEIETQNESLSFKLDSTRYLLQKKSKETSILKRIISELKIALNLEKEKSSESSKRADSVSNQNQNLNDKVKRLSAQIISENGEEKSIEEIRKEFAPRCAVMFSLNHPDCQSIFNSIFRYCPKTCSKQIEYIYGSAGDNLRRCGRRLNINSYELLYDFILSANLNPDNVSADEVRELLLKSLESGDLKRTVTKIYGATDDTYTRAIAVIKSIYKLS